MNLRGTFVSTTLALLAGLGILSAQAPPPGRVLYVAPNGNDAWSGRLAEPAANGQDGPLLTLTAARDALRRIAAEPDRQPATVLLRGGRYFLAEPLELGPEDSGTAAAPVTWAAYPGETPMLTGGRELAGWRQDADGAWSLPLSEVAAGDWYFRQLFAQRVGEEHAQRRYRPSRGAFVIAGLTNAPAREGMAHRRSQDEFRFFPGDIERWANLGDVEVVALHDWSASRLRIREIDEENHVVRFTGFPVFRIGHWWRHGRNPYYVENVKEAFGRPGEWYLDRPSGVLRYQPLPGETPANTRLVAPVSGRLVTMTGDAGAGRFVEHVRFRGLWLAHTHWALPEAGYSSAQGMVDLPAAFTASAARRCAIEECVFAHLGAYAISFGGGSEGNRIVGCRLFDLGGGGIMMASGTTANRIENNVVSDGGLVHFSAHGIWGGITDGLAIRHNVVRRFLYSNISVGWAWHDRPTACRDNLLEYNHIHDSMLLLADGGAIYTLGAQPGTVLRGNHIHDVHRSRFAGSAANNGFFFDQGSKGFLCERNLIYRTSGQPVRHNQNQPDWHEWVDNVFGVEPGAPGFAPEIAAAAGLEPGWRHLLDAVPAVPHPPILAMTLPPPPPPPAIVDTFEDNVAENGPSRRRIHGANEEVHIRVSDETAASGRNSFKFTSGPGAEKPFYPYLVYQPDYKEGVATVVFALRLGAGCRVGVDLRDYSGGGFVNGISLGFDGNGTLRAGDRELGRVPVDAWFRVAISLGIGEARTGTYRLRILLPDNRVLDFPDLPLGNERFTKLDWVGFIAHGTNPSVFYLDDVRMDHRQP